jgi:hypothetical protein
MQDDRSLPPVGVEVFNQSGEVGSHGCSVAAGTAASPRREWRIDVMLEV